MSFPLGNRLFHCGKSPDKYCMKDTSFAEILNEYISESLENSEVHCETTSHLEPAFLSQLIGSIPPLRVQNHSLSRKAYTFTKNQNADVKQSLKLKTHSMTEAQFKAYETILYSLELPILKAHTLFPEGFSNSQLKKAYKIAALRNHPDTGGSHESFLEIKKCYELLMGFAKTKPT